MINRGYCKSFQIDNEQDNRDKVIKCFSSCAKLDNFNWIADIPPSSGTDTDLVEIRFKNTRKGIYRNVNQLRLAKGDIVAVESSPGQDIGIVSLTGPLVLRKLAINGTSPESDDFKKIYRKAKPVDLDKWREAIDLEQNTMIRSRKISAKLNLDMKIGDVEYQGDKTKAIFYYIADERVDFRELIKLLADEFKIRVEMKQIGARQEAGRIGGIASCGRELCCSTWLSAFVSVTTAAARYQEVSLNPQKLAGQCGKLKCCINYEVVSYLDNLKDFPPKDIVLKTKQSEWFHQKTDVYRKIFWYSTVKLSMINMIPVSVEKVKDIIRLNAEGIIPENLEALTAKKEVISDFYQNSAGQDSLTRFDQQKKKKKKKQRRRT